MHIVILQGQQLKQGTCLIRKVLSCLIETSFISSQLAVKVFFTLFPFSDFLSPFAMEIGDGEPNFADSPLVRCVSEALDDRPCVSTKSRLLGVFNEPIVRVQDATHDPKDQRKRPKTHQIKQSSASRHARAKPI